MELQFAEKLGRSKLVRELYNSKNIIDTSDTHYNYPHVTFRINTLLDYIKLIKTMRKVHYTDETLVFRGMSNYEWPAIPSLARYSGNDESIEHDMVNEFLTLRPEAFKGLYSNFEILAKMQHYGLPTRLLDFTLNPLVALYFACSGCPKSDARILCGSTFLIDNQDEIIESICSLYKSSSLVNLRIEDIVAQTNLTSYQYIARLYLQKDLNLLFVKPWYWNQRIINQSAVFLVFPNTMLDYLGFCAYHSDLSDEDPYVQSQIHEIAKTEPLDQVYPEWKPHSGLEKNFEQWSREIHTPNSPIRRDFYINRSTMQKLFSYHQKHEIVGHSSYNHIYQYSTYGETLFKRRFLLKQSIDVIDDDCMRKMFCSIIIDKKAKKELLSDLEGIGIDEAFIYPELEYTAEKIKRKYFSPSN